MLHGMLHAMSSDFFVATAAAAAVVGVVGVVVFVVVVANLGTCHVVQHVTCHVQPNLLLLLLL